MIKGINLRIIDEPKNVYFPLERKVLFEKHGIKNKFYTFLPGEKLFALKLNILTIERYTLSNIHNSSSSIRNSSVFYFFDLKGNEKGFSVKRDNLIDSLNISNKISFTIGTKYCSSEDVIFFFDQRSCYEYLLKTGIPRIIKDSEVYFRKKDRNLGHSKLEYKKEFYKRAKTAKKELEKYFKNNA